MPRDRIDGRAISRMDVVEVEGFIETPAVSDAGRCRIYFNRTDGLLYYSEDGGPYKPFTGGAALTAQYLVVTRVLDEAVTAPQLVTATSGTNVAKADSAVEAKARVLGLALSSGIAGETIPVLLFGNYTNVSYSFTLNNPLFLNGNNLSETPPVAGWLTTVGSSNGTESVFFNIDEPIAI